MKLLLTEEEEDDDEASIPLVLDFFALLPEVAAAATRSTVSSGWGVVEGRLLALSGK
jgi:hypothetical protein